MLEREKMLLNCQWVKEGKSKKQAKPIAEDTSILGHDINYSYISLYAHLTPHAVHYGTLIITEVQNMPFKLF